MKYSKNIEKEEFSVAIPVSLNGDLLAHLVREDQQEDACFALYKPSCGLHRFTALVHKAIFPEEGERLTHGNVDIMPAYFRRALKIAAAEESGLILIHCHPYAGWQGMSLADIKTESGFSGSGLTITGLPFIGLTLGTDQTWSARVWEYNNGWMERKMASTVRVTGKRLQVSYNDTLRIKPQFQNSFLRTITVWGEKNHDILARLRVGIAGLGSVGSLVAETLARMGVERFVLLDFDEVQEHNLDRLLGANKTDIGHLKVDIAQRQIRKAGTAAMLQITTVPYGITETEGYLNALDCDVIFSCVDRPWPRAVLNHLAYYHLIPVIDGGIRVKLNPETHVFEGADWQLQTVGPERSCLRCIGAFQPADVSTEKAGMLDDPTYLSGLPFDHTFKRNENIFPFSANLASLEVFQFIEMVTGIGNLDYFGIQRFAYNHGYIRHITKECDPDCYYQQNIAMGDSLFNPPIGLDYSAVAARIRQHN